MGTTASNIVTAGTLAVTGASTLTGAASLGSTLAVTGASTLTGALAVTSTSTLTGEVRANSVLAVGTAAAIGAMDDNATTYSILYANGTDIVVNGMSWYDTNTGAYRRIYLDDGTLTAV